MAEIRYPGDRPSGGFWYDGIAGGNLYATSYGGNSVHGDAAVASTVPSESWFLKPDGSHTPYVLCFASATLGWVEIKREDNDAQVLVVGGAGTLTGFCTPFLRLNHGLKFVLRDNSSCSFTVGYKMAGGRWPGDQGDQFMCWDLLSDGNGVFYPLDGEGGVTSNPALSHCPPGTHVEITNVNVGVAASPAAGSVVLSTADGAATLHTQAAGAGLSTGQPTFINSKNGFRGSFTAGTNCWITVAYRILPTPPIR